MTPRRKPRVVFDTDIGSDVDDLIALVYILSQSHRIDLVGVCTNGKNSYERAELSKIALQYSRREHIPVYAGAALPLEGNTNPLPFNYFGHEGDEVQYYKNNVESYGGRNGNRGSGSDGIVIESTPAAEALASMMMSASVDIVFAVGTMTNVAQALCILESNDNRNNNIDSKQGFYPESMPLIYVMGGHFEDVYVNNILLHIGADYNLVADGQAALQLLSHKWMVPRCPYHPHHYCTALATDSPSPFVSDSTVQAGDDEDEDRRIRSAEERGNPLSYPRLRLVTANATLQVWMREEDLLRFEELESGCQLAAMLCRSIRSWSRVQHRIFSRYKVDSDNVAFLHDPLTIMSVIDASVVKFEEVSLRVFLDEKHILRTVRAHDSDSTMSAIHSTPALCATEVRTQYARDSIVSSIYNYLSMLHNEEKHHARNDTATRMEKTAAAL